MIQADMTYRALELLNLPPNESKFLLDIGCGSGLSGEILDEEGHYWVGMDIAPSMLEIALERELQGDLFLHDIGNGFGFRPGTFDGAISISVLQWLCNADSSHSNPAQRLNKFFTSLYASLSRGARAIFQFYPESDDQVQFMMSIAQKAGFSGGLVVDYPNSRKAKKFYLCLFAGVDPHKVDMPAAKQGDGEQVVDFESRREKQNRLNNRKKGRINIKNTKHYIQTKKDNQRSKGKEHVPHDSKYTGRKRKPKF